MVMYPIKLSFMIQVLLVFTYEVQTSKASENQRKILKESFQKILANDSEQLLITLQQIFFTPRQKNPNGLYLHVYVTVEGRVTDDDDSYSISKYCDSYFPQNNLCIYQTSMNFEVLPATNQDSIVKIFLNKDEIKIVLRVLDPSFQILASVLQSLGDSYLSYHNLNLYTHMDKVEIVFGELQIDVRNALYLTLSWVSFNVNQCNLA